MTFWSDHHGIIYGVRTIRVYELKQYLPYHDNHLRPNLDRINKCFTCIFIIEAFIF